MFCRLLLIAMLPLGALAVPLIGFAQKPDAPKANPENIAAALKLTRAAAAEYEIRVGNDDDEKPLELLRDPVLKWSNPDRGEIHGNVFVWTRDGRPLAVASLYKWFRPFTHMSHEFLSLAAGPVTAKFHGKEVWKTGETLVKFADVPAAPAPAAADAQRLLQMKQLAKEFSGTKKERDENTGVIELRLLPQPVYRYAAPKQGVHAGGLFAIVHGTDPEIWLLLEARGETAATAKWQYAAARMTSSEVRVRHSDKQVWVAEAISPKEAANHARAYTSFMFREIPDFLKDATKPKD